MILATWIIQSIVGMLLNILLLVSAVGDLKYTSTDDARMFVHMNIRSHMTTLVLHTSFLALGLSAIHVARAPTNSGAIVVILVQFLFTVASIDRYIVKKRLLNHARTTLRK